MQTVVRQGNGGAVATLDRPDLGGIAHATVATGGILQEAKVGRYVGMFGIGHAEDGCARVAGRVLGKSHPKGVIGVALARQQCQVAPVAIVRLHVNAPRSIADEAERIDQVVGIDISVAGSDDGKSGTIVFLVAEA